MESLSETYKECKLSPLDEQGLDQIQKRLERLGINAVRTETGTIRAELKRYGVNYILGHFVSGREVFYTDEHIRKLLDEGRRTAPRLDKFHSKQQMWLEKDGREYRALAKRVFIVDLDNAMADPQYSRFVQELALDMYGSLKVLCTLDGLRDAISSPFRAVAHRAFDEPFAHYTRASVNEFEKPVPDFKGLVNRLYQPTDFGLMCKRLVERKNTGAVLAVASNIFARIMGPEYSLVVNDDEVEMVRGAGTAPMPDFMVGKGELTAMSFCLFLALAHDRVTEGMCIGIKESLNYLDSIRHLRALAVLSDFVIATGAAVYFQTDKTDYRQFAEILLPEAIKVAAEGAKTTLY